MGGCDLDVRSPHALMRASILILNLFLIVCCVWVFWWGLCTQIPPHGAKFLRLSKCHRGPQE